MSTSWRDGASRQAQDDLDRLVAVALPFAEQMLDEHGEFYPYAVALDLAGELRMIAAGSDDEHPGSDEVLATLAGGLRAQRDELRAVAVVADVRRADSDAVRVELEHREGQSLAVFLPYRKRRLRRGVEYADLLASESPRTLWV